MARSSNLVDAVVSFPSLCSGAGEHGLLRVEEIEPIADVTSLN